MGKTWYYLHRWLIAKLIKKGDIMNYVGTFISGFEEYIPKLLKEKISDVKVIDVYNGLVVFHTTNSIERLPFFNNVYLLINRINYKSDDFDSNIKDVIKTNINFDNLKKYINYKNKTFKIKAFKENRPTKFNYKIVSSVESSIKNNLNLRLSNTPNNEFIIQQRSEGVILFMLKISNNRLTEKNIPKGSLRPEMSYLLTSMANLSVQDIVLDPFFGSGSIPKTIVKYFDYNMCFASEINHEYVASLKKMYKNNNKKLFIKEKDALNLDCFDDGFIDVIITDPPWNIFNKDENVNYVEFYNKMLTEFNRVLKKDGRLVILMGNKVDFEKAVKLNNYFTINITTSVLVNGKQANVYNLTKKWFDRRILKWIKKLLL